MKNKLLIGLLLIAQVSGVLAKGSNEDDASFNLAQMKKDAEIKAEEMSRYGGLGPKQTAPTQAQLDAQYAAYVKQIKEYNHHQVAKAKALQEEYRKQHPNQFLGIEIDEALTMTKDEWIKQGF